MVYRPDINSNFHQVGLVSFGSRICGNRIPGVYTNISSFLDWIDINLEEWAKSADVTDETFQQFTHTVFGFSELFIEIIFD